jgi:hypothetical protein
VVRLSLGATPHQEKGLPKSSTKANVRSIRRVAIDERLLDDVQTRLHSDASSKSRCLDAHALPGNMVLDEQARTALDHYR